MFEIGVVKQTTRGRMGAILRYTRVDELQQFLNARRGNGAIVGHGRPRLNTTRALSESSERLHPSVPNHAGDRRMGTDQRIQRRDRPDREDAERIEHDTLPAQLVVRGRHADCRGDDSEGSGS